MKRLVGISVFLFITLAAQAQLPDSISPADSLAFVRQAQAWSAFPPADSLNDWQLYLAIGVVASQAETFLPDVQNTLADATRRRETAEQALLEAKKDSMLSKETLNEKRRLLHEARKVEKKAESDLELVVRTMTSADIAPEKRRKTYPKMFRDLEKIKSLNTREVASGDRPIAPESQPETEGKADESDKPGRFSRLKKAIRQPEKDTTTAAVEPVVREEQPEEIPKEKRKKPEKKPAVTAASFAQYDPKQDVLLYPPTAPCVLAVERRDEFSGAVYRETKADLLFRYTNPVMRKALSEDQHHITCKAALASDGAEGRLLMTFYIKDPNARRAFGALPKNSELNIKFIDGDLITLFNSRSEELQIDPETGVAVFRGAYAFDKSLFKRFERSEIDQIRVAWSAGYEDYPIQQVDLLMIQAQCLR